MIKFEQGRTYSVKKEGLYELQFKCVRNETTCASFLLTKIISNSDITQCPILYSMLQDYYEHLHGKIIKKYVTNTIEDEKKKEVVFSNYENYLWIDSSNVL